MSSVAFVGTMPAGGASAAVPGAGMTTRVKSISIAATVETNVARRMVRAPHAKPRAASSTMRKTGGVVCSRELPRRSLTECSCADAPASFKKSGEPTARRGYDVAALRGWNLAAGHIGAHVGTRALVHDD